MQVFGQAGAADQDAGGWKHALNTAFEDFKRWLKATKIRSSQKPFRLKMLVRDGYGFYLNAKAYNARVIAEWLLQKIVSVKLQPGPNQIPDDRMELCEIAMTLVISIVLLLAPISFVWYTEFYLYNTLRRGVCRYFGLSERASRFLPLASSANVVMRK